jgi:hypothetical protein
MHVCDLREYIRMAWVRLVETSISMSSSSRRMPKNPVSTDGQWVERADFKGHKSFGYFCCHGCSGKNWVSAHAFVDVRQGCKQCRGYTLARYLWVNNEDDRDGLEDDKPHSKKRHFKGLCENCLSGKPCVPD